jgi:ABC-type phosphate transport system substrate-binding protein
MRNSLVISALTILMSAAPAMTADAPSGTVVIIVNQANPIENVSTRELKQLFQGARARWPDGEKIQTLAPSASEPGHKEAVRVIFGMTEADFQKFALHAAFVNNPEAIPRDSGPSAAVVNLVSLIPGGIGFVHGGLTMPRVKVLKIDGKSPGDPDYPLK